MSNINRNTKKKLDEVPKFEDTLEIKEDQPVSFDDTLELLEVPSEREYSKLESLGLGAFQGITFGGADEIEGFLRGSPVGGLKTLMGVFGKDIKEDEDVQTYKQARDEARKRYASAQEQNPLSFLAGEIGGGFAVPIAGALGKIGKAKTGVDALKNVTASAIGAGALGGALTSKADLTEGQSKELGEDIALGAGIGAALPLAGKGSKKVLEKLANLNITSKFGEAGLAGTRGILLVDDKNIKNLTRKLKEGLELTADELVVLRKLLGEEVEKAKEMAIKSKTEVKDVGKILQGGIEKIEKIPIAGQTERKELRKMINELKTIRDIPEEAIITKTSTPSSREKLESPNKITLYRERTPQEFPNRDIEEAIAVKETLHRLSQSGTSDSPLQTKMKNIIGEMYKNVKSAIEGASDPIKKANETYSKFLQGLEGLGISKETIRGIENNPNMRDALVADIGDYFTKMENNNLKAILKSEGLERFKSFLKEIPDGQKILNILDQQVVPSLKDYVLAQSIKSKGVGLGALSTFGANLANILGYTGKKVSESGFVEKISPTLQTVFRDNKTEDPIRNVMKKIEDVGFEKVIEKFSQDPSTEQLALKLKKALENNDRASIAAVEKIIQENPRLRAKIMKD